MAKALAGISVFIRASEIAVGLVLKVVLDNDDYIPTDATVQLLFISHVRFTVWYLWSNLGRTRVSLAHVLLLYRCIRKQQANILHCTLTSLFTTTLDHTIRRWQGEVLQ